MFKLRKTYNILKLLIIPLLMIFTNTIYSQKIKVIDNKGTISTVDNNTVTSSNTEPTTPLEGDVWFNTSNSEINIYDADEPIVANRWKRLSGENLYTNNGTLTGDRDLNGGGNNFFLSNIEWFNLTSNNFIRIQSNGFLDLIGASGINIFSNIRFIENITVEKGYIDSTGSFGTNGQILSSTSTATQWINNTTNIIGTTGSIFFAGATGASTENNSQLFWDNTNNRLRIGNALSGTNKLSVQGVVRSQGYNNSNGTVGTPSYRFSSDSNTGMYRIAENELGFTTDGINALSISATQDISIPNNLSVTGTYADTSGDVGTAGQILSSTAIGTNWINNLALNNWSLLGNTAINPTINFLGTTDAQPLVFKTNNIERLKIHETKGQVLINGAPTFNDHPLVIRANGVDVLAFQDATGTPKWHWNLLANGLNFVESGVLDYRLFLENGGNIGINTDTPSERLDIDGKLRIREISTTTANNDILTTTATGVIEKKVGSKYENTWTGKDDNLTADKNDTEIYKNGKVGVGDFSGATIDAQLHVKSTGTNVPFKIEPNTTTPTGTSGGQMFVDSTNGILYIYDGTRNKWLSVDRTMVGWGRNSNNTTNEYLRQFNGALSIDNGWKMIRNGTITAISAQTNRDQNWTLEIRKNDATTIITSLTMTTQGNHNNTINIDINEGDFIQAYCNGNSIDFPQALIEIAWRK